MGIETANTPTEFWLPAVTKSSMRQTPSNSFEQTLRWFGTSLGAAICVGTLASD